MVAALDVSEGYIRVMLLYSKATNSQESVTGSFTLKQPTENIMHKATECAFSLIVPHVV